MLPRFHPLARLILCLTGVLLSLALVGATISGAIITSARWTNRPPGRELEEFFASDINKLVSTLLAYPFILLCLLICRRSLDRRSFASLGLRPGRAWREMGSGLLCGALAMSFLFGVMWACGAVAIQGPSPEAFQAGAAVSAVLALLVALAFFCVGWMEEVAFRGYALHNLNAWLGWSGAVAVQALVFAAIHPLNQMSEGKNFASVFWDARWALVNIALIAVFFAQCYRKTGALWFPIGFHAAWNFFQGTVWSLPVSGLGVFRFLDVVAAENIWSGGSFGAEGSPFLTPILAGLIYLLHRQPDHPQALLDLKLLTTPLEVASLEPIAEESEPGQSRFKTSMRPTSETPQLDPKIFQTAPVPPPFSAPAPVMPASAVSESAFLENVGAEAATPTVAVESTASATSVADIGAAIAAKTGVAPTAENTPETQLQGAVPAAQSTPESRPETASLPAATAAPAQSSVAASAGLMTATETPKAETAESKAAESETPRPVSAKPKSPRW